MIMDIIEKKRDGGELTREEIQYLVDGFCSGEILDYQMTALLMATYFQGLTDEETYDLTMSMLHSGKTIDLSGIEGIKVDKHSTGGVGDKISLVLCPMLAALGVKMPKLSGRALGHTGGTIDKLESIPGFSCDMTMEKFTENVNKVGFAIGAQTEELVPADKKMYALRDLTCTVGVKGLIVSSIMSKKLASNADIIVLDVKCGGGAFMRTEEEALELARAMVDVGKRAGKKTVAVISDMSDPLGYAIGNALEVKEALSVLKGRNKGEVLDLCLALGTQVLLTGGLASNEEEAKEMLTGTIESGAALKKFEQFVSAQEGDPEAVRDESLLPDAPVKLPVTAGESGYIRGVDAEGLGHICTVLGGSRTVKDGPIDRSVGIIMKRKYGDRVGKGEEIAIIHAADEMSAAKAAQMVLRCMETGPDAPEAKRLIKAVVR